MAIDIARGMQVLHRMKPPFVHGDLRSSNIMLDRDHACKISDIRIPSVWRALRGNFSNKSVFPGGLIGLLYTSVYSLNFSGGSATPNSDVHSFGLLLWELYTRESPFQGLDPFHVSLCVNQIKPPPLGECPEV